MCHGSERQILRVEGYKWKWGQEDGWEDQAGPGGCQLTNTKVSFYR